MLIRRRDIEDVQVRLGQIRPSGQRPDGTDVVDDPRATTMRSHDQVVVAGVNHQRPRGRTRGKASLRELGPVTTAVHRDVQPELRAQEKQVGLDRILLDHMHVPVDLIG